MPAYKNFIKSKIVSHTCKTKQLKTYLALLSLIAFNLFKEVNKVVTKLQYPYILVN